MSLLDNQTGCAKCPDIHATCVRVFRGQAECFCTTCAGLLERKSQCRRERVERRRVERAARRREKLTYPQRKGAA